MEAKPETPPLQSTAVLEALRTQDPLTLSTLLGEEALGRLELAEKVLELEHNRRKRTSWTQNLLGLVAFGGLLVNAFQSYNASKTQEHIREADQKRWSKEFERAKAADRYNAFLATSALATDSANPDKRLVGYALLQEFVDDKEYNGKTTLMLEQALFDELDRETAEGLSEEGANAVNAILTALSGTSECSALARAVRSVGRLSRRKAKTGDVLEAQLVFELYVRRLYGRAAEVCKTPEDFAGIERPLRETLEKSPEIGGLIGRVSGADATKHLAQILIDVCKAEMSTGLSECPDILRASEQLCQQGERLGKGAGACALFHDAAASLPTPVAKVEKPKEESTP